MNGNLSPGQAAEVLQINPPLLRQLSGSRYFESVLEAPRDARGFRQYTPQDIEVLRYAIQRQKRGLSYESTLIELRTKGITQCLLEDKGSENLVPVLEAQAERLRAENANLLTRIEYLQQRDQLYERARTIAAMVINSADTEVQNMVRSLDRAEVQHREAMAELKALQSSLWGRIFGGPRLATAVAKLEEAARSRQDAVNAIARFDVSRLQEALALPAQPKYAEAIEAEVATTAENTRAH